MEFIDNIPFKFNAEHDQCFLFDKRQYCQMVEQSDHFTLIIKGSKCYNCSGVLSSTYDVSCPFSTSGLPSGNWALTSGSTTYYTHTAGATTSLSSASGVLSGYWEITYTIKKTAGTALAGSITAFVSGIAASSSQTKEGTYRIYITSVSAGLLQFTPSSNFNGQIGDISFSKINTDYSLYAFDLTSNALVDSWPLASKAMDYFYLTGTWSSLGLPNGCYYFKISDACDLYLDNFIFSCSNIIKTVEVGMIYNFWVCSNSLDIFFSADNASGHAEDEIQGNTFILGNIYQISFDIAKSPPIYFSIEINGDTIFESISGGTEDGIQTINWTSTINGASNIVLKYLNLFNIEYECWITDFTIVNTSDINYIGQSECYSLQTIHECTKLLKWTNEDNAFNIPYSEATIVHYLRLYAKKDRSRYPTVGDTFKKSNGESDIIYAAREKIWRLSFDYLPEYIHDAISIAKIHDHFFLDNVEYISPIANYDPEWRDKMSLSQSNIEIQKKIDNNINYNCE